MNSGKKLFTATKIPPKNFQWPSRRNYSLEDCFPPDHIQEYVERSLKNAGLDSFDLMQFHTWEDSWLEDDRWVSKMNDLKKSGTVSRNWYQHQPLGTMEWREGSPERHYRFGAGDLQYLRSKL